MARLLEDLNEIPALGYEELGRKFLEAVSLIVGGRDSFLLVAKRLPLRPGGYLGEWHILHFLHERVDPERDRLLAVYLASGDDLVDPRTLAQVADAGRDRAYLRHQLVPDAEWERCVARRLDLDLGHGEAINAAVPLDRDTEVYLGLHRAPGEPPFTEDDRDALLAILVGARPALRRGVKGLGILEPDLAITPRQRAILALLMTGASEKEIASQLRLAQSTVHTHVVTLYRVFRVRSRPELMALWTTRTS